METNRRNFIGGIAALASGVCIPSFGAEQKITDIRSIVAKDIDHCFLKYVVKARCGRFSLLDCLNLAKELQDRTQYLLGSKIHKIWFAPTIPKTGVIGVVVAIQETPYSNIRCFRCAKPCLIDEDIINSAKQWTKKNKLKVEREVVQGFNEWIEEVKSIEFPKGMSEQDRINHIKNMYVPTGNILFVGEGVHHKLTVVPSKKEMGEYDVKLAWKYPADWSFKNEEHNTLTTTVKLKGMA
jgi:hypothetical protein